MRDKRISDLANDWDKQVDQIERKKMESYDELIDVVSKKMEEHKDDNTFGIFSKIDRELLASSGTAFEASGYADYFDWVVFNDK